MAKSNRASRAKDRDRRSSRARGTGIERLEPRLLLAADPVITEFMASNGVSLADGNGDHPDWIEIQNKGDAAVNLLGWHLTDDPTKLDKWTFPARTLNAGQFLVVFASGNDSPDPAGNLHTNFTLDADGEYLALTRPNLSVATEFGSAGTNYPKQIEDVSYGPGTILDQQTVLGPGNSAKAFVPTNSALDDQRWTSPTFDDSAWGSGTTGVGFDTGGVEDVQPPPVLKSRWSADDLAASVGGGQTITSWTDPVGGKTAAGSGKPVFQTNVINGHAVVRFNPADGTDQLRVTAANSPMSGAEDYTIVVVFRTATAGVGGAGQWTQNTGIVDATQSGSTADWGLAINSSGQIGAGLGGPDVTTYSSGGLANGAAHVAVYTRVDDTVRLFVDGGDGTATAGSATARNAADMVFGSLQTNANYFNGDIAEVDVYQGGVDTATAYALAGQLGSKYAITVTAPSPVAPQPAVIAKWTADDLNTQADNTVVNTWVSSVGSASASHTGSPKLEKNQLNGHSVIRFDPSDGNDQLRIAAASSPMAGRGDFSLAVVFRTSTPGVGAATQWYNNTGIVDGEIGGVTNDWGLVVNGSGQVGAGLGNPDATLYSNNGQANGQAHVAVYTRRGASYELSIDGGVAYSGTGATAARTSADMVFGSLQTNINYYKGDIAEVQVYGGALDTGGVAQLAGQLAAKYGVALAPAPYDPLIGLDLQTAMSGQATSAYVRVPFTVDDPAAYDRLTLRMRYDDGFIAYLNGVEVARRNAPIGGVGFTSAAIAVRADSAALTPEDIDISSFASLLRGGGATNVLAIHALNSGVNDPDLLVIPELVLAKSTSGNAYFATPTPGTANGNGYLDYVRDVKFSVDRGIYNNPFTVDLTTSTPGATIVYTTDGSVPTLDNGTVVNAADANTPPIAHVNVATTTVLRATAFKNTLLPTNVDTSSYILISSVLTQKNVAPSGAYWDTEVDPNVVNATQTYSVTQALTAVPTISLVLPDADMFGPGGLYANPLSKGPAWERETSVEYFDPNNPTSEFQLDAGIRIQGGVDRDPSRPKKSFRIFFRNEYGAGKLNFPILGSDYPVSSFDTLILKGGHNYNWANAGGTPVARGDYLRDEFARRTQAALTGTSAQGTFVQLYINGLYWGQYGVTEEPDESWAAAHMGGDKSDYDVIQPNVDGSLSLLSGDFTAWNTMFSTADSAMANDNTIDNTEYGNIRKYVDVDNLIDYMMSIIYRGDQDAPTLIGNGVQPRNFYAIRKRAGGLFQFQTWDGEISLETTTADRTETAGNFNPARLYQQLRTNAEFRQLVADHVYKDFFNGGPLSEQATADRYRQLMQMIDVSIVGESARWGDAKREPAAMRDTDWLTETGWLLNTYFPQRTGIVFNQLKNDFAMLAVAPPQVKVNGQAQHGGNVNPGDSLTFVDPNTTGGGTIYYTIDGSDPRVAGGGVSASARLYTGAFAINQNLTVKMRIRNGTTWSAIDVVDFTIHTLAASGNLVVSEINYNPADPTPAELAVNPAFTADDFEFVELLNTGNKTVDLLNAHFDQGVSFNFGNTSIAPGQRAVLVRNASAFQARYGSSIPIAGVYSGTLSDGGEPLRLRAANSAIIDGFTYDNSGAWPGRADGKGSTLELISPTADVNDPANWRSSYEYGGTPGSAGVGPQDDVVVNEVLSNTDATAKDAIELHNTTTADIDLSGWFLSDSSNNYRKFRIPDGTMLPAGGYLVFDEDDFNPTPAAPGPNDFALDGAHGDDVWLLKAAPGNGLLLAFADSVHFDAAPVGVSLGRWPDATGKLYPMTTPTLGASNSGPRIGPAIISEIMYHPVGATTNEDLQYIEVQNVTDTALDVSGWRFDNGIDFSFPAGTVLAAHEPIVVVHFDPADATRLAAFRSAYGIDAGVRIVGPWSGTLSDIGETVRLARPDAPPATDPTFTPFVLVEEVAYDSAAPWPTGAATGAGQALARLSRATWGDDPTNWAAQAPTVGSVPFGHAYFQGGARQVFTSALTTLDSLTIRGNATAVTLAAGGKVLRTGGLSIQDGGTLDVNDGYVIIDANGSSAQSTLLSQVNDALRSGYAGAHWTGTGIVSGAARADGAGKTAVGVLLNDNGTGQPLLTAFAGQTVDAGDILVRYTLIGDADLSGAVDTADFSRLYAGLTQPTTYWATGDFNYDARTDIRDYQALELNIGSVLSATVTTAMPVPASTPVRPAAPPSPKRPKPAPVVRRIVQSPLFSTKRIPSAKAAAARHK
ncbi:MAG TPA: lamin tail domain-containing protein [Tepidisphaeraceae bacterium]